MERKKAKTFMLMNKHAWVAEDKKAFFSPLLAIG
jgi:hypothetical protein